MRGRGGVALARHLCNKKDGQRVQLLAARHLAGADLGTQLSEMVAGAVGRGTDRPILHIHVDPPLGFDRPEVIRYWLQQFEQEFGLEDQPRAGVLHSGKGGSERLHGHFLYNLVLHDGHVVDLRNSYRRREKISVITAYELGLPMPPVPRPRSIHQALLKENRADVAAWFANNNPDLFGPIRIASTTPRERLVGERTGINPVEIVDTVGEAWIASGPFAFRRQLAEAGLLLARGERGPVIVDQSGSVHSLGRIIRKARRAAGHEGPKAHEVRRFLGDLRLPPLDQLRKKRSIMFDRGNFKKKVMSGIIGEQIVADFQDRTRFVRRGPPHRLFMHDGSRVIVDPARRRLVVSAASGDAEALARALVQIEPYEIEIETATASGDQALCVKAVRPRCGRYQDRLEWWQKHGQHPALQQDGIAIEVQGTHLIDRGNKIQVGLPPSAAALDLIARYAADHWDGGLVLDVPPGAQDWPEKQKERLWWACRKHNVVFHGYNPPPQLLSRWEEENGASAGGAVIAGKPCPPGAVGKDKDTLKHAASVEKRVTAIQARIDELKSQWRSRARNQEWIDCARSEVAKLEEMQREMQNASNLNQDSNTVSRRLD